MYHCRIVHIALLFILISLGTCDAAQEAALSSPENSVVLIRVVKQGFDYVTPWKRQGMSQITGTGFIIEGPMILTNAHNISNCRYIEIRKQNTSRRYPGKVVFAGHDCDLAILTVEDSSFFEGMVPLELAGLPQMDSTVSTYGFPMGGERISVTKGVVSRIESDLYSHSGADEHLVIQTDAAINPGNSGGPVIQNAQVVGVAFQGLQNADNIGYLIPTTVIKHFLKDIEDGRYDGFGSMGAIFYSGLHSDSYREYLQVPENQDGLLVISTMLNSSVENILQPEDVVTSIDNYNIDNDGMIQIHGMRLSVSEAVEQKQIGETLNLTFYRQGQEHQATVSVALNRPIIEQANQYDSEPPYVCFAGMVFVKVNLDFLESWGARWRREVPFYLKYMYNYSIFLNDKKERNEFIVLSSVLADEVNSYAEEFSNNIVESINGIEINSIEDVYNAFKQTPGDFYTIKFMGQNRILPIEAEKARSRHQLILEKYDVPAEALLETE